MQMQNKVRVHITGVKVNAPTYTNVTFTPSLINFFYGKNGTGKSTLAKAFKDGNALLTGDGQPFPDERVLVYNEDFIAKNVQSYGNIPGVFTISEVNAVKKKEADDKTAEKAGVDAQATAAHAAADKITEDHTKAEEAYISTIWDKTETTRKKYPLTQTGYTRDRRKFVKQLANTPMLVSTDEECAALYKTVYGKQQTKHSQYTHVHTDQITVNPIMEQAIISRANTDFALFIRTLGNMDWVTAGHKAYHGKTDGRCPYCQKALPEDFEDQLAACYDNQYKDDLAVLGKFMDGYYKDMMLARQAVEANLQNPFPTKRLADYKKQAQLLLAAIQRNCDLLQKKKDNPSEAVTLEDLVPLSTDLNTIITAINDEVDAYMAVLADIPGQQQKCTEMVWGMMANDCSADIRAWLKRTDDDRDAWKAKNEEEKKLKEKSGELEAEIAKLNSQTVNTTKAMQDINRLIASAGFKGFELQEKPGAKYVYELVRDQNGKKVVVDKNLSEGERHFIAFLYFYHMVMGSQSDDGKMVDKIVIIDDPVSSMDSSSLFVVASLTREMIAVCYNNYELNEENTDDHIRQFFCMTHNPYFFREVTYNRLSDYECVSFFEIKKGGNNQTSIEECDDDDTLTGGGKINRSPVRNTYDALWDEYMHTDNPETMMMVIRQILEYYFVQMVGYHNVDLRRDLLDKHEKEFTKEDYVAASAMIAMINVGATGFNDGLYYDSSAANVSQLRSVFERIFSVMGQEQHYNMMTRRTR
jgi:wobble nucleotide-excising tRNase